MYAYVNTLRAHTHLPTYALTNIHAHIQTHTNMYICYSHDTRSNLHILKSALKCMQTMNQYKHFCEMNTNTWWICKKWNVLNVSSYRKGSLHSHGKHKVCPENLHEHQGSVFWESGEKTVFRKWIAEATSLHILICVPSYRILKKWQYWKRKHSYAITACRDITKLLPK
jgi:hypothetical protein